MEEYTHWTRRFVKLYKIAVRRDKINNAKKERRPTIKNKVKKIGEKIRILCNERINIILQHQNKTKNKVCVVKTGAREDCCLESGSTVRMWVLMMAQQNKMQFFWIFFYWMRLVQRTTRSFAATCSRCQRRHQRWPHYSGPPDTQQHPCRTPHGQHTVSPSLYHHYPYQISWDFFN